MLKPAIPMQLLFKLLMFFLFAMPFAEVDAQKDSSKILSDEDKFNKVFDEVMKNNRYTEELDSGSFYNLPLGIRGGSNTDPSYSISVDEVVFYPDKAEFSASMVLTNPFNGEKLVFAAKKVVFSFSGGILGTYRLELISEKPVSICKDIGLQILKGSYVECDCRGFKSLKLKGNLELSPERFALANTKGKQVPGKVNSYFETTIQNWNDLTFSISLPPFQLKQYPDFTFQCDNLAVDFSDLKNPEKLKFPASYKSSYTSSTINLWRGVYIGEANLILGEKFKRQNASAPISFGVKDLIIDELGFSGKVIGKNLLGIEEGSIAGWKFSIDEVMLEFNKSDLVGGSLAGLIHVPAFEDKTNFAYSAKVDVAGNYAFVVRPQDTLSFNLFGRSKLDLYKTSYISIVSDSTGFVPTACFNGQLTINTSSSSGNQDSTGSTKVSMPKVEFQNFKISTREPFIDIGYFAYHGSEQGNLSKFPFTINDIIFKSTPTGAKLSIVASVNLKGSGDEGFGGTAGISLLADRNGYKYIFKGVQVDKIKIKVVKPGAFSIEGEIAFARGDSVYGNGFRGMLKANFNDKIDLQAVAIFGNVKGNRYFFVDAMFAMTPGIQAGPITIFGFGGGLYHHMKQHIGQNNPNSFGASLSGIVYKPDESIALGIRASVKAGIITDILVNAQATFEIAFTNSGGLAYVGFEGSAKCITPPINIDVEKFKILAGKTADKNANKEPDPEEGKGAISAHIIMTQDFQKKEFHAEMEMMVNIAGVITGVGNNNRAGWAVVHAAEKEWYIHIGSPTEPIGLNIMNIVKTKAYFMAGHHLPTTLPINPRVMQILNIDPNKLAGSRNEAALENAKGLAFGASFELNTGDLSFAVFYASFELGAGFDILLTNNGPTAYCKGHNAPLGINGWYAKGQAYAYLAGKIGIEAKVFRKTKKFEILSIAAAAFLRAEAPNPVWMIGYVGGEYRLLGGMIKGKCRFEVEIGEKCEMMAGKSAIADLQLISDVSPANKAGNVDVFTTPQVVFNVPIDAAQKISEDDGSQKSFRIKLVKLELQKGEQTIAVDKNWNSGKDVVQVIPVAILTPNTSYSINAEIAFEEYVNNAWVPFTDNGQQLTEKKVVAFTTGELPDKIPLSEVTASYPVNRQYNFMPGEYNKTYFMFRRDMQVFFNPSEKYNRKARWTKGGSAELTNLSYNSGEKTLYMDIPRNTALSSVYSLEVVAIPITNNSNADRNVTTSFNKQETGSDSISMEQKEKKAEGTITTTEEKVMLDLHFKTSKYQNFASRFNITAINVRGLDDQGYLEYFLVNNIPGNEPFDIFEQKGAEGFSPLIKIEADLANTPWYQTDVFPKNYQHYPWFKHEIQWRNVKQYGLTAVSAIVASQPASFTGLTDNEITAGTPLTYISYSDIAYMLPYIWTEDYYDIRNGLANTLKDATVTDPTAKYILEHMRLRPVKPGGYPVTYSYVLPGKNIITSTKTITLNSTIKTDVQDF